VEGRRVIRDPGGVLVPLERLFNGGTVAALSEGQLLERFVARRDEAAFAALVARHGPMVLGVCRRVLRDRSDVEDAFQATFLVFVRRAGAIRDGGRVGHWLYGVAHRVAVRARANAARRFTLEKAGGTGAEAGIVTASDDGDRDELRAVLDDELSRLPETLRAPLVLCYLDGLTHDEAAQRLGWPVGTVRSRMARARDKLRQRLTRRGLSPDDAALAAAAFRPAVPEALLDLTVRASLGFATHEATAAALASASAAALARGILHAMTLSKLSTLGAATAACALALGGLQTFAVQLGGIGAETAPAAPQKDDRRESLVGAVDRLEKELAESTRRNAVLQRQVQDLREELESLRASAQPSQKGVDIRSKDAAKEAARKAEAVGKAAPGGGEMRGMMGSGVMTGRGGGSGVAAGGGMPGGMMGGGAGYGAMMGGTGGRGMGGYGGMMRGMMMGGGMPGMGPAPDSKNRLQYISTGRLIVVASPEGDKVTAYSTETGKAKSIRLSEAGEPRLHVQPVASQNLVALYATGPKVKRIAAFSVEDGTWYPQDLREPVQEATPVIGNLLAAYGAGRRVYAFSPLAKRWDVLELPEGTDVGAPTVSNEAVTVEHDGHLYVFSGKTGKWEDISALDDKDAGKGEQ
jgi:RNA polymerase sigma factor (sigma-70 family)